MPVFLHPAHADGRASRVTRQWLVKSVYLHSGASCAPAPAYSISTRPLDSRLGVKVHLPHPGSPCSTLTLPMCWLFTHVLPPPSLLLPVCAGPCVRAMSHVCRGAGTAVRGASGCYRRDQRGARSSSAGPSIQIQIHRYHTHTPHPDGPTLITHIRLLLLHVLAAYCTANQSRPLCSER